MSDPIKVDYLGTPFTNGMALAAEDFHKEWKLGHEVLTASLQVLFGGEFGLLRTPDDVDPLIREVEGSWRLKAGSRLLMPSGIVLRVREDYPFLANSAKGETVRLRCEFLEKEADRYKATLVNAPRDSPAADGLLDDLVDLVPEPRLFHLRATHESNGLVEQLGERLRKLVEHWLPKKNDVKSAAIISAALDLAAELATETVTFDPLIRFRRKLRLLSYESRDDVVRNKAGIQDLLDVVLRVIDEIPPFPPEVEEPPGVRHRRWSKWVVDQGPIKCWMLVRKQPGTPFDAVTRRHVQFKQGRKDRNLPFDPTREYNEYFDLYFYDINITSSGLLERVDRPGLEYELYV